jgi:hypothetical protein
LPLGKRFRKTAAAVTSIAALAVGLFHGLGPSTGGASSHREAPLISADPQVDNTDVYAFVSPDSTNKVTLISNWIPFEEPAGGPNFYAFAENTWYNFNIDNDGDAIADLVFGYKFTNHYVSEETFLYNTGQVTSLTDPDLNFYQTMNLVMLDVSTGQTTPLLTNKRVVPSRVGDVSMPDYASLRAQGTYSLPQGGKTTVGQADDPFFLDLRAFDLLYGLDLSEVGDDTLAGFNVNSIVLQVPKSVLAKDNDPVANPIFGVWVTAVRPSVRTQSDDGSVTFSGSRVQVSRLGMPLVNEVVVPVGKKDLWNASKPQDDGQFLSYVNDPELARLIEGIYGIPAPDSDPGTPGIQRDDLIEVFLTGIAGLNQPPGVVASEQLRLNMSISPCEPDTCAEYSTLGVIGGDLAGYPNGRRLADDTIDISLQVVEGILLGQDTGLGDAVDENDVPFLNRFPYLARPHSGSDTSPHGPMRKVESRRLA